jgi:PPIC-type peptidyl-prolyl cis-trans isomerase-like protein
MIQLHRLFIAVVMVACSSERPPTLRLGDKDATQAASIPLAAPDSGAANGEAEPAPYPPGRWRQAAPDRLRYVVLWLSHILVRHEEARNPTVNFSVTGWRSSLPPASRSRPEALRLALELAERARKEPERFSELAAAYSEDITTRRRGGSLGGMMAVQLFPWPEVLDALEATPPGDVSRVIETSHGFHVLYRRKPPRAEEVSGRRLLIAYDDAPWSEVVGRGNIPRRSRTEALALATSIYDQARQHPEAFEGLVRRRSEHEDAVRGGYFGTWSTLEPSPVPREIEALQEVGVGDITAVIDTPFGYQVLQRIDSRQALPLAMSRIELHFDATAAAESTESRDAVLAQARASITSVLERPARFAELQGELCCTGVWPVLAGRHSPAIETALAALRPGEIAREPIEIYGGYWILQRLDPSALPPVTPTAFDLPTPAEPDAHEREPVTKTPISASAFR